MLCLLVTTITFLRPIYGQKDSFVVYFNHWTGGMHIGLWLKSYFLAFNIFFRHKPKKEKSTQKGIYQQTLVDSWGKHNFVFLLLFSSHPL